MPSRNWQNRLQDVLVAIAEIQEFTAGKTFEEFQGDRKTIRAVLYDLAIVGEAVRSIPPEVEALYPEIPWLDVRGMRNIVIHEYFQVNLSIHLANGSRRPCFVRVFSSATARLTE